MDKKMNAVKIEVGTVETTIDEPVYVKNNKKRNLIILVVSLMVSVVIIAIVLGVVLSNKAKVINPFRASNLKKVLIVTRHGARTSFKNLPIDIQEEWQCDLPQMISYEEQLMLLNSSTPKPCPAGELVKAGFNEHKELGKRWKKYYIDTGFINSTYNQEEVYLRSTNITRTRASLLGQLSTMFASTNLFHVENTENANDGFQPPPCPWADSFTEFNYLQNPDLFPAVPLLQINTALKTNLKYDVLYDTLRSITGRGDPIPSAITQTQYDQIATANDNYWKLWFCSANTTRSAFNIKVNIGPIFAILRDFIDNKNQKLSIFSAHDTTLAPLMSALTRDNWQCVQPPFAANIVIEVNLQDQVSVKYLDLQVETLNCGDGVVCGVEEFNLMLRQFDVETGLERVEMCKKVFD